MIVVSDLYGNRPLPAAGQHNPPLSGGADLPIPQQGVGRFAVGGGIPGAVGVLAGVAALTQMGKRRGLHWNPGLPRPDLSA